MQPREAEGALRNAQARALNAPADPAADRAEVLAPVVPRPDLVPVDEDAESPLASARAAAARSEKYGNDAVCTTS